MVRLRLKRRGKRHAPLYHIVVMDSRTKRQGSEIEKLGFYNPITKQYKIAFERIDYWMSVGAQPSDGFKRALKNIRALASQQSQQAS